MKTSDAKALQALDAKANRLPLPGVGVACKCGSVSAAVIDVDSPFGTLRCLDCGAEMSGIGWTLRVAEVAATKDGSSYPRTADELADALTDKADLAELATVCASSKLAVKSETRVKLDSAVAEVKDPPKNDAGDAVANK